MKEKQIEQICNQTIKQIGQYNYVAFGIGLPLSLLKYYHQYNHKAILFSDNGVFGVGPLDENEENEDMVTVGRLHMKELPYTCYMDSNEAFTIVHGGHIDAVVLGAMEVSQTGDISSWHIPGKMFKGCGGAMDLLAGIKNVIIMMWHTNKDGQPKIVKQCSLPLTAKNVVNKIITEMGVFQIDKNAGPIKILEANTDINTITQKTEAQIAY